jgi:prophage regulatory protein
MRTDILQRLRIDPGQRTLGQLLQDREAAALEIERLRAEINRREAAAMQGTPGHTPKHMPTNSADPSREPPFRAGTLIRLADVCRFLGISRSTVYKKLSESSFPKPARLGPRTVRWRVDDIEAWRDAHSASQTN